MQQLGYRSLGTLAGAYRQANPLCVDHPAEPATAPMLDLIKNHLSRLDRRAACTVSPKALLATYAGLSGGIGGVHTSATLSPSARGPTFPKKNGGMRRNRAKVCGKRPTSAQPPRPREAVFASLGRAGKGCQNAKQVGTLRIIDVAVERRDVDHMGGLVGCLW